NVVEHGPTAEHTRLLKGSHHPQFGNLMWPQAVEPAISIDDVARAGLKVAGNGVERGGFAGTVRPNQREHLAIPDLEAHVIDRGEAAEPDRKRLDRKHDRAAVACHLPAPRGGLAGSCALLRVYPHPRHQDVSAGTIPSGRK